MSHHHHDEAGGEMTFDEKMLRLFEHWIKHNHDHAATYQQWSQKAKQNGLEQAAGILAEAVAVTDSLSRRFERAAAELKKS
jgi:hypothetical protein